MRLVRSILAFAIALSLAAVPFGSVATAHALPSDDLKVMQMADGATHAMASHDMATHEMAAHDAASHGMTGPVMSGPVMSGHVMSGHVMAGHACCPGDDTDTGSANAHYKCGDGFCCTGFTIALGEAGLQALQPLDRPSTEVAIPADQVVSARSGSPPFRPPRV